MMSRPQLYAAWFCPFAQRAWIALNHAGVNYDYHEVDTSNKTPQWLAINPTGKVPAIVHNEKLITESRICVEYVDEAFPGAAPLLPSDPYDRAYVRMWCEHIPDFITAWYTNMKAPDQSTRDSTQQQILSQISTIGGAMREGGPYFMGSQFGLFDVLLYPFVLRLKVCEALSGFQLPPDAKYERFQTWAAAIAAREDVKSTIPNMDRLIEWNRS